MEERTTCPTQLEPFFRDEEPIPDRDCEVEIPLAIPPSPPPILEVFLRDSDVPGPFTFSDKEEAAAAHSGEELASSSQFLGLSESYEFLATPMAISQQMYGVYL
jgi:hypothetical protein